MMAAEGGHLQCLSVLLAHGADLEDTDVVSVRGVCSIAYSLDVACIGVGAEGMHCNLLCLCCQL